MIFEDIRTCPRCNEDTIFFELETRYTSHLSRQDLHGEIVEVASLNEDGTITKRPGRAFTVINVYVEPHLPDSKVNHVLKLEQRASQGDKYDLYATCPNCGFLITIYTGVPNYMKVANQPYDIETVPFNILPSNCVIYDEEEP